MRVRVLFLYTQVVKQSNSVSLETPTTEGGLSLVDLSAKVRTPPLRENTAYLLTNSPEIRSSHFCAYSVCSFHNLPIGSAL